MFWLIKKRKEKIYKIIKNQSNIGNLTKVKFILIHTHEIECTTI